MTRTAGVPFPGPYAGEVEEIEVVDSISTLAELALVIVLAALWRSGRRSGALSPIRATEGVSAGAGVAASGVSRRDFLRTAGVVGALYVSGGVLGSRTA